MVGQTKDFDQQFCSKETDLNLLNLSFSILLDVDEDPSFVPEFSFDTDTDISQVNNESINIVTERKSVASESQLDQLLKKMFCLNAQIIRFMLQKL